MLRGPTSRARRSIHMHVASEKFLKSRRRDVWALVVHVDLDHRCKHRLCLHRHISPRMLWRWPFAKVGSDQVGKFSSSQASSYSSSSYLPFCSSSVSFQLSGVPQKAMSLALITRKERSLCLWRGEIPRPCWRPEVYWASWLNAALAGIFSSLRGSQLRWPVWSWWTVCVRACVLACFFFVCVCVRAYDFGCVCLSVCLKICLSPRGNTKPPRVRDVKRFGPLALLQLLPTRRLSVCLSVFEFVCRCVCLGCVCTCVWVCVCACVMIITLNKRKQGFWWTKIYLACVFVRLCMSQLILDKSVHVTSGQ